MQKYTILAIVVTAFIVGTLVSGTNLAEAVGGWKAAFDSLVAQITTLDQRVTELENQGFAAYREIGVASAPAGQPKAVNVFCDAGDVATGGGFGHDADAHIIQGTLFPHADLSGYGFTVTNTGSVNETINVYVVCADVTAPFR